MSWRVDFDRLQYTEESSSTFSITFSGGDVSQFQNQYYYSSLRFGIATGQGFASASSGDIDLFGRQSIGTERDPVSNVLYDIYEIPVSRGVDETGIRWRNIDDAVEEIENFQVKIFGVSLTRVSTGTEIYVGPSLTTSSGRVWQFVDPSNASRTVQVVDDEGGADEFTDLLITNFAVSGSGSSGSSVTASFGLVNLGSKQVGGGATGNVRFLDEAGSLLQDTPFTTSTLQPNGSAGIISPTSFSYLVPLGFDGNITVEVVVDADEDETVLSNNRQAQTIGFTQNDPLADLTAEGIVFVPEDLSISDGDTGFVRFRVTNLDDEVASERSTADVVVRDPSGAVVFTQENITVLPVAPNGGQQKQTGAFTLPAGVMGEFSISVAVNASGAVPEAVTTNNLVTRTFSVSEQAAARALGDFVPLQRSQDGTYFISEERLLNNDLPGDFGPLDAGSIVSVGPGSSTADGTATLDEQAGGVRFVLSDPAAATGNFTYSIQDGTGALSQANVNLSFQGDLPDNNAPVAVDDSYSFSRLSSTGTYLISAADLLANDIDADGDVLELVSVIGQQGISATLSGGSVTVRPADDVQTGAFSYLVADPDGLTSTGLVSLTFPDPVFTPTNVAPFVSVQPVLRLMEGAQVALSEMMNGYDSDGQIANYKIVLPPGAGRVLDASGNARSGGTVFVSAAEFALSRFEAGPQSGDHSLEISVLDDDGAESQTAEIGLSVFEVAAEPVNAPPEVTFDTQERYSPSAIVMLDSIASFRDVNGSDDITSVLLGDFSGNGGDPSGHLVNRATGDVLRATAGHTAYALVDISDFGNWAVVSSPAVRSGVIEDQFLVAPVDSQGVLPGGVANTLDTDAPANLTVNVLTAPRVVIEAANGGVTGFAGQQVGLATLVSTTISVDRITVSGDSPVYDLVKTTTGQVFDAAQSVAIRDMADWAIRFETLSGPQVRAQDNLVITPFAGEIQGTEKRLSVALESEEQPEEQTLGLLGLGLDMLADAFEVPVDGVVTVLRNIYETQNVKYLLTLSASASYFVKASTKTSFDLMDALGLTVEGAGGYDGNPDGKVTVWQSLEGTLFSSDPGLEFAIGLTPMSFDPEMPDLMAPVDLEIAQAGLSAKLGSFGVKGEVSLDLDGAKYAYGGSVGLGIPSAGMKLSGDLVDLVNGNLPTNPEIYAKLDFGADSLLPWVDVSMVTLGGTLALGEISRGAIADLALTVGGGVAGTSALLRLLNGETEFAYEATVSDGLTGTGGRDTIVGGDGNDVLEGASENDMLDGGPGDDTLLGGDGFDVLKGGPGRDAINAQDQGGVMIGGADGDNYHVALSSMGTGTDRTVIYDQGRAGENDVLYIVDTRPPPLFDPLTTILGPDNLYGRTDGSDLMLEIREFGSLIGEIRIVDQATAENHIESIVFLKQDGTNSNHGVVDLSDMARDNGWFVGITPANVENDVGNGGFVGGAEADIVTGGDKAEVIQTNAGDDLVFAGAGNDTIVAGSGEGRDIYDGGEGVDALRYPSAVAAMVIDLNEGTAFGGPEIGSDVFLNIEQIEGGQAGDEITGNDADNTIAGASGDDGIIGRGGNDSLSGGQGRDYLSGDSGDDTLEGGQNDDTLEGGSGDDSLAGDDGADSLLGGDGADTMDGGTGADILNGGSGNDRIETSLSNPGDTIDGGAGTDTVVIGQPGTALISAVDLSAGLQSDLGGAGELRNMEAVHWVGGGFADTATLRFDPSVAALHRFDGAGGIDRLVLPDADVASASLAYDAQSGTQTLSIGVMQVALTGVEMIAFGDAAADQTIWLDGRELGALGEGRIDLGGGNQTLDVRDAALLDGTFILDGGGGDDHLVIDWSGVTTEIRNVALTTEGFIAGIGETSVEISGFESLALTAGTAPTTIYAFALDEDNVLIGGPSDDSFDSGDGDDSLVGNGGDDRLASRVGDDTLIGGQGEDHLRVGTGDTSVRGGDGSDTLTVRGPGLHFLHGDAGDDHFVIQPEAGTVHVFGGGDHDRLFYTAAEGADPLDLEFDADPASIHALPQGGSFRSIEDLSLTLGNQDDILSIVVQDDSQHNIDAGGGRDVVKLDYSGAGAELDVFYQTSLSRTAIDVGDDFSVLLKQIEVLEVIGSAFDDSFRTWAPDVEMRLHGGDGEDSFFGSALADDISGGDHDDFINGRAGDDFLKGDDGDDQLSGEEGQDTLEGGAGDDDLYGGENHDRLLGQGDNDFLRGEAGDDTLIGGAGDDNLNGESGSDRLKGGLGDDYINGGEGFDTAVFALSSSEITVAQWVGGLIVSSALGTDTIHNSVENFQFKDVTVSFDDMVAMIPAERLNLYGTDGDDTLIGDTGEDTLQGAAGNDMLQGADGIDRLIDGQGADFLSGDSGDDTITLVGTMFHTAQYVAHNASSVTQTGTGQRISLDGKVKIEAVIDGGADVDTINLGGQGDAFFLHDAYSDFHHSLALAADYVGNDSTQRFINIQNINGLGGDDIIDLTSPDYSLAAEAIRIDGNEGNDVIWGSDADEIIHGGTGDDTIFGGIGTDLLIGGAGADTFQFTRTSTDTTVDDFDPTAGDTLEFFNNGGATFDPTSMALTATGVRIAYEEAGTSHEIDIALAASADEFSWSLGRISSATDFL